MSMQSTKSTDNQLLTFKGKIGKINIASAKEEYQGQWKGGGADIIVHIDAPTPPRRPYKSYPLTSAKPEEPKRKKGEAQPTFDKRMEQYDKDIKQYEKAEESWDREMKKYEAEVRALSEAFVAYAQVVGYGSLLGGHEVEISLKMSDTSFLPGFDPLPLLSALDDRTPASDLDDDEEEATEEEEAEGAEDNAEALGEKITEPESLSTWHDKVPGAGVAVLEKIDEATATLCLDKSWTDDHICDLEKGHTGVHSGFHNGERSTWRTL